MRPEFLDDEAVIDNAQGILAGEGFDQIETVSAKPIPGQGGQLSAGYQFTLHCMNCSAQACVMISWLELVELAAGAVPTDRDASPPTPWIFNRGKASPRCHCQQCAKPLYVYMTPDEAARYVNTGIQMGAVNRDWAAQTMNQIRQSVARAQQQRR